MELQKNVSNCWIRSRTGIKRKYSLKPIEYINSILEEINQVSHLCLPTNFLLEANYIAFQIKLFLVIVDVSALTHGYKMI